MCRCSTTSLGIGTAARPASCTSTASGAALHQHMHDIGNGSDGASCKLCHILGPLAYEDHHHILAVRRYGPSRYWTRNDAEGTWDIQEDWPPLGAAPSVHAGAVELPANGTHEQDAGSEAGDLAVEVSPFLSPPALSSRHVRFKQVATACCSSARDMMIRC